jgi:predicted metal-dependent hydrolase
VLAVIALIAFVFHKHSRNSDGVSKPLHAMEEVDKAQEYLSDGHIKYAEIQGDHIVELEHPPQMLGVDCPHEMPVDRR